MDNTGPLEQANDTKELNQTQLPLLGKAKLVDNSEDDPSIAGGEGKICLPGSEPP